MGLITENVIIKWERCTCAHYKKLGYIFTKIKDEFEVKVEDLKCGSNVKVDVQCDNCNKIMNRTYESYLNVVRDNNIYYCNKCANKLFGKDNLRKTLLKKHGKSFENFCLNNNRQDILNRWDYELNVLQPNEICQNTNKKYYFKCPQNIHKSELKSVGDFVNGHEGVMNCNQCNSFAQWGINHLSEDFLEKYWDYDKNELNPWEISYGSKKDIWLYCQEKKYHSSNINKPNNFINGNRCPYCCNHRGKVHPLDSLGTLYPQVLEIWSSKNKETPYEYAPTTNQKVWWKCSEGKHKDYKRDICNSYVCDFRCVECSRERDESFLQEKVRLYLNKLGYTVLHEYDCTLKCINPKTNCQLRYDNQIVELKLIIEVHGIQHYEITNFHKMSAKKFNTTPEEQLQYQKYKDKYKKDYALKNNYNYLEIPYWTDNKDESWKQFINNKIDEII